MIPGKFNVVLDAQWGSSGKGKLCAFLADAFGVSNTSSSNMPNAGHTVAFDNGNKYVVKCVPSALALNKELGYNIRGWISPGSSFFLQRLNEELELTDSKVIVHERAQLMNEGHRLTEQTATKGIASTMQGCAAAMCDKIMRGKNVELMRNMKGFYPTILDPVQFRENSLDLIQHSMWLHEVSQGYALSIDHGTQYPNCTSRNCTTQAAMDQMSIPPNLVGDVYLNFRPYPIRVGNVVENGVEVGYSGDFAPWGEETTWDKVADASGMPDEQKNLLKELERTTVTKRVRRVGTLSLEWLKEAAVYNGATKLSYNFLNYVDWSCHNQRGLIKNLPYKVRAEIARVEDFVNLPVVLAGTGANHESMCTE